MKKGRLYALMGFVVLVVGTALYTVNFLYEKEQTSQAVFDTKSPEVGNVILKTVASGSIQPRQEILIKPQVSGIVREVHIEAGDLVKAGEILAEVTIVPNIASLSNAENRLSRATRYQEMMQKQHMIGMLHYLNKALFRQWICRDLS